jgi:hypothetical protein
MAADSRPRTRRRSGMSRRLGRLGCAVGVLWIVGCVTYAPTPPPAPPPPPAAPAPRALTITAQRRQSQAEQDRDKADCQAMASGQATSSDSWAQIFTACMGGRGYLVQ